MNWSEAIIISAIARQTLAGKCVVLVDNCSWTGNECDVLAVTMDLRVIDVEVKISRADLKADAGKGKWWHGLTGAEKQDMGLRQGTAEWWDAKTALRWPRRVWKHYYAMPRAIWKPELLDTLASDASGVLLLDWQRSTGTPAVVSVERRAKPNPQAKRLTPESVLDIARLGNLRMWDAYKTAEQAKDNARLLYGQPATEGTPA